MIPCNDLDESTFIGTHPLTNCNQPTTVGFDFEDVPVQSGLSSPNLSASGLIIDINHPNFRVWDFGPPNGHSLQSITNPAFIVNFPVPISSFSVDFYDGGADEDIGLLEAFSGFDAMEALIDSDTKTLPNSNMPTLDTMFRYRQFDAFRSL